MPNVVRARERSNPGQSATLTQCGYFRVARDASTVALSTVAPISVSISESNQRTITMVKKSRRTVDSPQCRRRSFDQNRHFG
jgi:hypothetical protein